ncbi:MAG: YHS domain-containing (seleno)protein [Pseudomonadota bacterium]
MPRLFQTVLLIMTFTMDYARADTPHPCSVDGVAIGGYDLVSYHQSGGPQMGLADIDVQYDHQTYLFANADNRALFLSNPSQYLPRYQGWCAATLSMGRLACPDYTNFKIEDGQLLLFELVGFTNGRTLWNSDPLGFRTRADANALELLN